MVRTTRTVLAASVVVLGAACAEGITSSGLSTATLAAAFTSAPSGIESTTASFNTGTNTGSVFVPSGGRRDQNGGGDHTGLCGFGGGDLLMGGGFGPDFLGGPGDGRHPFDGGLLSGSCTFNSSTGIVTCAAVTHDGLTINRTAQYLTAGGVAQATVDSTTNTIKTHVDVSGTVTRHDSSVTSTVHLVSDRTVTGLAKGSTQRTVNGTSAGTENSTGTNSTGSFTAARVIGDSITALVIPVADGHPSYPISGTVIRGMQVTVTYSGQSPKSSSRREVITYDGSATAKVTVTQDGTTKTCTLPLPHGRPTCS